MKHYIKNTAPIALLLIAACGAPEQEDLSSTAETSEIATLDQPLVVMPDGYGWTPAAGGIRCWNDGGRLDWPADCYAPARRTASIVRNRPSCRNQPTYGALYEAAMIAAANDWRSWLQTAGWSIRVVDVDTQGLPPRSEGGRFQVVLSCGSVFSGSRPDAAGGTSVSTDPNCDETSAGDLCKYESAHSRLYPSRVKPLMDGIPSATNAQRVIMFRSIFNHEAGHGFGLGHDEHGPVPLTALMSTLSDQFDFDRPSTWAVSQPNSLERSWLAIFSAG